MTDEATSPTPKEPDDKPGEPAPSSPDPAGAREDEEAPLEPAAEPAGREPSDKVAEEDATPPPAALAVKEPYRPNYIFLAVVSLISLALDLGTKIRAKGRLEDVKALEDRRIEVIPKFVSLAFARNKGGAWGLLQEQPESIRRPFFLGISALAIVFIVSLYRRLAPEQRALKWGLPLVLGGALGNLINRIQYNYVIDFIDVYYVSAGGKEHHWPVFNVADIAICVGVGLMAIDMFTARRPPAGETAAALREASAKDAVERAAVPVRVAPPAASEPPRASSTEEPGEASREVPSERDGEARPAEKATGGT